MGTPLVLAGYLYIKTHPKDVISDISPPLSRLHNFDIEELVHNYHMYMFAAIWASRFRACRFPGVDITATSVASDKGVTDA